MATDEQKAEVDKIIIELFADDEDMMGELFVLLCMKPELYATAYKLRGGHAALKRFLTSMMDRHTRTVEEDVPMTDPDADDPMDDCKWPGRAGSVLIVGMLGYEFCSNIRSYWKGEIDGYKCAENLTGACVSVGAGVGGFWAGGALLAGAGPVGIVVGAIAGSVFAAGATQFANRKLFEGMFGTDRDRAFDKAYAVLGLRKGDSPEAIRHAYLSLAKKHHPDKGGDKDEFLKVNGAYELIRASILS